MVFVFYHFYSLYRTSNAFAEIYLRLLGYQTVPSCSCFCTRVYFDAGHPGIFPFLFQGTWMVGVGFPAWKPNVYRMLSRQLLF